jgi:NAD(P)H dehydrogenase (quinone)
MGRVYGGDRIYQGGVFQGKRALLSVTTGGPREAYAPDGFNGDIHAILRPIQRGMLRFVGFDVLKPHIVFAPVRMEDEERQAVLEGWSKRLRGIEKEDRIQVGAY